MHLFKHLARVCRAAPTTMAWRPILGLLLGLAAVAAPVDGVRAEVVSCTAGPVPTQGIRSGAAGTVGQQPDLTIKGACTVDKNATYVYGKVNIVGPNGSLTFNEPTGNDTRVNFWASSIIVEKDGALLAGVPTAYGIRGGILTIYLYGADLSQGQNPATNPGQGATCETVINTAGNIGPCGIPNDKWTDNGKTIVSLPGGVSDYFYQYGPLYGDDLCSYPGHPEITGKRWVNGSCPDVTVNTQTIKGVAGYFGYKVLAVSYGGTLRLNGYKGTPATNVDGDSRNTGFSWLRLTSNLKKGDTSLSVSLAPTDPNNSDKTHNGKWWNSADNNDANNPDRFVVTTTDYLPGHSELLTIKSVNGTTVTFANADPTKAGVQWPHNGTRFLIKDRLAKADPTGKALTRLQNGGLSQDTVDNGAQTRAAVALLTRSIRIVSAGDTAGQTFQQAGNESTRCKNGAAIPNCYSFGGHTVFRQGFTQIQVQGVEFENLGQGGKKGHYPVHFHKTRIVPAGTYVKDSSANDSNTRWFVVHSTQGITFQRNVGFKSIGHGYYLEDGTETDNAFYSNIGILARASLDDGINTRKVPGILSDNSPKDDGTTGVKGSGKGQDYFPYFSDYNHPSVFWISNGWNDFVGNMAAGATACGACYWFVPAGNADKPDVETTDNADITDTGHHMKWTRMSKAEKFVWGYSGLQRTDGFATSSPLKSFAYNYCSSAMNSFITVGDTAACHGVVPAIDKATSNIVKAIPSFAPFATIDPSYYPYDKAGGYRQGTFCPAGDDGKPDCSQVANKCSAGSAANCAVTVLDHYVSSFHWAEQNLSAIWLRNQWYLMDNSFLSDVQNGGLTFITGGDYTYASTIPGYWALAKSSLFVGHSQTQTTSDASFNGYASDAGPFNNSTGLKCDWQTGPKIPSNYCLSKAEGISMPIVAFAVNQRLFNIYDGPAYQDGNAYFDITTTDCPNTGAQTQKPGCMYGTGVAIGVRKVPNTTSCYLPNAAVAWKQPNGFFYPPAFHSNNLVFDNVDIRHYVINPLFKAPDGVAGTAFDFHQGGTYLTDTTLSDGQYCTNTPDMFNTFSAIDRQTELSDDDGSLTGLLGVTSKVYNGTISVNQDPFFTAPVETAECRSNLDISPDNACKSAPIAQQTQTARTSPYDYVAVAIEPECSQTPHETNGVQDPYGRCGDDLKDGFGGYWSSRCSNQYCYGIPLFRQLLVGSNTASPMTGEWKNWSDNQCNVAGNLGKPQCRWPFDRMAGQNLYQRETLLANNGLYYLDTTISQATQQTEHFNSNPPPVDHRDVNLFEKNKTYYVYFLYAKPTTKLTLQIYVGPTFQAIPQNLYGVRGNLATAPLIFTPKVADTGKTQPTWLKLGPKPVSPNGVLTVTVDFTGVTELLPTAADLCQPRKFCKPDGSVCSTSLDSNSPAVKANPDLLVQAGKACQGWAMKDLDCPAKGCLGFAFKLPDGFAANGQGQAARPGPISFAAAVAKGQWPTTQFDNTETAPDNATPSATYKPSSCFYKAPLPGTANCSPLNPGQAMSLPAR